MESWETRATTLLSPTGSHLRSLGTTSLGMFMTHPSSPPGGNLSFWLMVSVACLVFLFEARRARSNRESPPGRTSSLSLLSPEALHMYAAGLHNMNPGIRLGRRTAQIASPRPDHSPAFGRWHDATAWCMAAFFWRYPDPDEHRRISANRVTPTIPLKATDLLARKPFRGHRNCKCHSRGAAHVAR